MKTVLLTEEIKKALPELYATEEISLDDKIVICKWFCGPFTWFCVEGEKQEDNDWLFFGYVKNDTDPDCSEFGYWTLSQLEELTLERRRTIPFVELDLYFKQDKLSNVLGENNKAIRIY